MRLAEPIETTGMFWLPERPETGLSGVLRISETSEITVEFAGVIGNPPSVFSRVGARATPRSGDGDSDLERIVGTVEKGGRITLDGCFRQSSNMVLPSGLFRSTFYSSLAFLGVEYGKKEQASFLNSAFQWTGLMLGCPSQALESSNSKRVLKTRAAPFDSTNLMTFSSLSPAATNLSSFSACPFQM